MAELIKKETIRDNPSGICKFCSSVVCANCFTESDYKEWIDNLPTIDIVFCKECKHYGTEDDYDMCNISRILHDDDYFCRDGERKNNG